MTGVQTCALPISTCQRIGSCRTYQMWKGLDDLIEDYFSHITIADLASPEEAGNDYVI